MRPWLVAALVACHASSPPATPPTTTPPTVESAPLVLVESPPPPDPARYCERAADGCWDCTELQFGDELPCAERAAGCAGICLVERGTSRCAPSQHVCCPPGAPCEKPPIVGACAAECGDRTGDNKHDRCLIPSSCPYAKQLDEPLGKGRIPFPVALYETLCGPLPAAFPSDQADGAKVSCGPEDVLWTIHPRVTERNTKAAGPALCYGQVRVSLVGDTVQRCGKFHCQTLRECDGSEKQEYCTVIARCDGNSVVARGFSW